LDGTERTAHSGMAPTSGPGDVRRLKILHVVSPAVAGGLERVVQALAIGHHRRGHEVALLVVLDEGETDHPFLGPFRAAGVPLHVLPLPPHAYLAERKAFRRLCRELDPQIVHTHGYRPDVVDRGVAAQLGIATVTTIHGASFIGGLKGNLYEWIQRLNYRRFDAVVVRRRVTELGLETVFRFYHDVTDAGPLFGAFDVYVLSSRSEGLPVVLLEAMAAGTPIVATRVGGVPDALGDDDARLVPAE